jgi:outer membrane protein assembly factor BamD
MKRNPLLLVGLLMITLWPLAACRSGIADDPILRLSAEESLAKGKELLAREKYAEARKYLSHAYEAEPNSSAGREGLLLAADTLFLQGGTQNLIQAEAKYRDFRNRFPTSDKAAYVHFQIGKSLAARMERPDRDQSDSQKALEAFQDVARLYPTSEFAEPARTESKRVLDNLAEHEFVVGLFYLRYGLPVAAVQRFEHLLSTYTDYSEKDKVLYHLGRAYQRQDQPEQAAAAFERLRTEFPQSRFVAEAEG